MILNTIATILCLAAAVANLAYVYYHATLYRRVLVGNLLAGVFCLAVGVLGLGAL